MAGETGQQRFKLPYDAVISPRSSANDPIKAEDEDTTSPSYIAAGLLRYQEALHELARQTENHSNPVDEYNTASLFGAATTAVVTLQPTYEYMPEKITSALVAGPPTFTTLPSGILPIPLSASGTPSYNPNPVPVQQNIQGGTVTAISIGGVVTGQTSGVFNVPAFGTVSITYTVAPTVGTGAISTIQAPNVVTVILGDRQWQVTMPSTGIAVISPIGIILGRNDPRQLIASVPGTYFLELMGWADKRFRI